MRTFLGTKLKETTLAVFYLCEYSHKSQTIKVVGERLFDTTYEGLEMYANIRNPESQLATGKTPDELKAALALLHKNLRNPEWVKDLANAL